MDATVRSSERLTGSAATYPSPYPSMLPAPRVTVVTPTYNRAGLLRETIESILSQSFQDFEYIIVDDGSTDDTESVVRSFGDRVIYCHHENVGEAESTNRGWRLARGHYFAVVSSDDPVAPNWLEEMVAFLDARPELIVAYPEWRIIDENSNVVEDALTWDYSLERMVGWLTTLPGPGSLIRKGALSDIDALRDPTYRFVPDLESWMRLGLRGEFARVPKQLANWRTHPTSITVAERSMARAEEMIRLVVEFFDRGDLPDDLRGLRRYSLSRAYWLAAWIVHESAPIRSHFYLRKSYALASDNPPGLPPELGRYRRPKSRRLITALLRACIVRVRTIA